jgi:hypothetical protein
VKRSERKTTPGNHVLPHLLQSLTHLYLRPRNATQEDPCVSESESQFKGIRGFLWLAAGFLLLAAAVGSAIYIVVRLLKCL